MCFFGLLSKKAKPIKVVNGFLIASFTDSVEPVIWQINLQECKAINFSVEKIDVGNNVEFALIVNSSGNKESVARFDSKEKATKVLSLVSSALENQSASLPVNSGNFNQSKTTSSSVRFLSAVIGVVLLGLAVFAFIKIGSGFLGSSAGDTALLSSADNTNRQNNTRDSQQNLGKPVSADEYLRGF